MCRTLCYTAVTKNYWHTSAVHFVLVWKNLTDILLSERQAQKSAYSITSHRET